MQSDRQADTGCDMDCCRSAAALRVASDLADSPTRDTASMPRLSLSWSDTNNIQAERYPKTNCNTIGEVRHPFIPIQLSPSYDTIESPCHPAHLIHVQYTVCTVCKQSDMQCDWYTLDTFLTSSALREYTIPSGMIFKSFPIVIEKEANSLDMTFSICTRAPGPIGTFFISYFGLFLLFICCCN